MLPVKVVGTVAFGVHHGIQHVAHMVSGTNNPDAGHKEQE
jgi:hypothetical protein